MIKRKREEMKRLMKYDDDFDETPLTDNDEAPLTDFDDGGVIYEPSGKEPSGNKPKAATLSGYSGYDRKPQRKMNFKLFMPVMFIVSIGICVGAFYALFTAFSTSSSSDAAEEKSESEVQAKTASEIIAQSESSKIGSTMVGVIKAMDEENKQFTFLVFSDNRTYTLKATDATDLKDRHGTQLVIGEFAVGDVVDFVYDANKNLTSIAQSQEGWEYENSAISYNTDACTVTVGGKTYGYNAITSITNKGEKIEINKIDEYDLVTVKGYQDTAYSINIEKGHTFIKLNNAAAIKDGIIEVDTDVHQSLSSVESIKVSEGTHKIVVKGSNIIPYTKDIIAVANEDYVIDLSKVQIKSGVMLIKANVSDYKLYINGKEEKTSEPLMLNYGAYSIKVEKEGYQTYETQINLNKDQFNLNIELKENVPTGKLTVNTVPDNAEVYVDNQLVGNSPISSEFTQGKHNLTIKKDGYNDFNYTGIDITSTESVYNINLQQKAQEQVTTQAAAQTTAE